MTTIFLSYRRDDAAAYAGRLYDGLRERYGGDHVFMDVDRIQPGENFAAVIERSVRGADVVLVVIGQRWLSVSNEAGRRRLDDPEDFVRLEVKAALDSGQRVIPVLVGGARMPGESSLPPVLRRLAGVQAVDMSDERWDYDSERLTRSIDGDARPAGRRKWMWMGAAMAVAMAAAGLGGFMATREPPAPATPPATPPAVTLRTGPAVVTIEQARAMVAQRDFFHARWNAGAGKTALEPERQVVGTDIVIQEKHFQLMWQQNASARPFDRNGAGQYLQELNARGFAGHSDWRLPTLEEALSLMGSGTAENCHLHPLFGRSQPIVRTADTSDSDVGRDWIVYFCDGIAVPEVAAFSAPVRAVRSLR